MSAVTPTATPVTIHNSPSAHLPCTLLLPLLRRIPEAEVLNLARELRARGLDDVAKAVEEEAHREAIQGEAALKAAAAANSK